MYAAKLCINDIKKQSRETVPVDLQVSSFNIIHWKKGKRLTVLHINIIYYCTTFTYTGSLR